MSTQTAPRPSPGSTVKPYRLTVRQFLKAIKAGVFPHDVRLELLGGVPVEKMTSFPPHNSTVYRLVLGLRAQLPFEWIVFEEKPFVASRDWRPIPDLMVIQGPIDRYIRHDPNKTDVALVVEVSDTTHPKDRGFKWRRYASAGLPIYWIINLESSQVETYADPSGRGKSARYRSQNTYAKGDAVPVVIGGREVGRIAVNDFMP